MKLQTVIEALEMADQFSTAYYDTLDKNLIWLNEMGMTCEEYQNLAEQIEEDSERYITMPTQWEINEYGMMEDFIDGLPEGIVQNRLARAIQGRGAFRRFKDAVYDYDVAEQWYAFRDRAYREFALGWCKENGVQIDLEE